MQQQNFDKKHDDIQHVRNDLRLHPRLLTQETEVHYWTIVLHDRISLHHLTQTTDTTKVDKQPYSN